RTVEDVEGRVPFGGRRYEIAVHAVGTTEPGGGGDGGPEGLQGGLVEVLLLAHVVDGGLGAGAAEEPILVVGAGHTLGKRHPEVDGGHGLQVVVLGAVDLPELGGGFHADTRAGREDTGLIIGGNGADGDLGDAVGVGGLQAAEHGAVPRGPRFRRWEDGGDGVAPGRVETAVEVG